jgi:hypothetical protein
MKPGHKCKHTGKRSYGSHEEAARKGVEIFGTLSVETFRAYECPFCHWWHLTTQESADFPGSGKVPIRFTR